MPLPSSSSRFLAARTRRRSTPSWSDSARCGASSSPRASARSSGSSSGTDTASRSRCTSGVSPRAISQRCSPRRPSLRPVLGPTPFLDRLATGEEWRDDGAPVETVDDARRLQMAALLARQITLCAELPAASVLAWVPRDERLWPTPHNALFDFERTAAGAEWIDEIAAESRKRNRAGSRVLAHQDWSVKHFRWEGDAVTVIYDWDSLFVDNESISVGAAAATHTYPPEGALPWTPSLDDTIAFLAAYERARPLDGETRRAAEAQAVYSTAYTSRCEHAIEYGRDFEPVTGARAVLRDFAAR